MRGGLLMDYEGGTPLFSNLDIYTIPCDVFIPAALGGLINAKVAAKLQCKVRDRCN